MCIFSGPVREVSKTKIFARLEDGVQHLAYAMNFSTDNPVAMILPIPIKNGRRPEFVNLENYPELFEDIAKAFPEPVSRGLGMRKSFSFCVEDTLPVENVGSFEASFVPSLKDFSRLDPRFRLPAGTEDAMTQLYKSFGFVVFQLKTGDDIKAHPMAFNFETSEMESVFYPTVHVHHGKMEDQEHFDHVLYLQMPPGMACVSDQLEASKGPLGNYVSLNKLEIDIGDADVEPPKPLLRNAIAYRQKVQSQHPNRDIRINLAKVGCPA